MCNRNYAVLLKRCVGLLAIPLGAIVCGILGLVAGAYIGGNFAQNFTFIGSRGYEAASLLGLILGSMAGGVLSLVLVISVVKRHTSGNEE